MTLAIPPLLLALAVTSILWGSYGTGGWTKDGKSVLLYDRYDIWRISPDGTGAKNITAGYGRSHDIRLRYTRVEADSKERWIDPAKPLLLSGENLKTMDQGFFRGSIDGAEPKQMVMAGLKWPPLQAQLYTHTHTFTPT